MRTLLGVLSATLLAAAPAVAAEPGVHVDPNSPAGKEYGIPLEQARQGSGGAAAAGGSGATGHSALFGAGIRPVATVTSTGSGGGKAAATSHATGHSAPRAPSNAPAQVETPGRSIATVTSGGGGVALIAGLAGVVLLLGLGGGLGYRKLRGTPG